MLDEHQEAVGARIASLREQQGWSQRALAKWVGLDQSAVSRIESGHRRLSADELQRFARAFQISADDLLPAVTPAPASPSAADAPRRVWPTVSDRSDTWLRMTDDSTVPQGSRELGEDAEATAASGTPAAAALPPDAEHRLRRMAVGGPLHGAAFAAAPLERLSSYAATDADEALVVDAARRAASRRDLPIVPGLPESVAAVARDWFALRRLAEAPAPAQRWSTGHSAEGKPERIAHTAATLRPGAATGDVLYDRVARFWRSELHVDPDDGPLPDLIPLLEDGYGAQVVVARVADADTRTVSPERPVAAAFSVSGVPFIFVNAARPVVLQRFALAHAFAHHVLGHGEVLDRRIEWSRNIPPEAAANDFTEEFLAPVRAVQRWYERRGAPRWVRMEDLLDLGNAFGISAWSALFRSRAAGRLQGKQFHILRGELRRREWELLPRQAYLGGLRDTLSHLTPSEVLPSGSYGAPAVLRVPAPMRAWALAALQEGRLSLEDAAALLRTGPRPLAEQLALLGLE